MGGITINDNSVCLPVHHGSLKNMYVLVQVSLRLFFQPPKGYKSQYRSSILVCAPGWCRRKKYSSLYFKKQGSNPRQLCSGEEALFYVFLYQQPGGEDNVQPFPSMPARPTQYGLWRMDSMVASFYINRQGSLGSPVLL